MDDKILESLQELGLSNRESICYTALLELGSSTVGIICNKTQIPSSKIYEILENLISKGLVTYVIIGKIKHYQATDPRVFLGFIDERKKSFEQILPQLLSKQVSYDAEYQLSADVANIGVKGYVSKIGDTTEYFPPHRIYKIDIEEIKS